MYQYINELNKEDSIYTSYLKELKKLINLETSPYFGRVDFTEMGKKPETLYIGLNSLVGDKIWDI